MAVQLPSNASRVSSLILWSWDITAPLASEGNTPPIALNISSQVGVVRIVLNGHIISHILDISESESLSHVLAQSQSIAEVVRFEKEGDDLLERVRNQFRQLAVFDTKHERITSPSFKTDSFLVVQWRRDSENSAEGRQL